MSRYYRSILATLGKKNPDFQILVKTDNTGVSGSDEILLPIQGTSMFIDWGDGITETVTQANAPNNTIGGNNVSHTYASAGTYTITISNLQRIFFNNGGDRLKPIRVVSWGTETPWGTTFDGAFNGCGNIISLPNTEIYNSGSVTTFNNAFRALSFIDKIPNNIFKAAVSVTNINNVFFNTLPSDKTIPDGLLSNCTLITTAVSSFRNTGVLDYVDPELFNSCPDITSFSDCFTLTTIPTGNYSDMLVNLEATNTKNNVLFGGGNSKYNTTGQTARNILTSAPRNWTITDGGLE
jgi:hypothetical protein